MKLLSELASWKRLLSTARGAKPRRKLEFMPRGEELEERVVPAISAQEQLLVYLLNRARSDPFAYQQETGINADLSGVAPQPALAINDFLFDSAGFHAEDMAARNYFDHNTDPPDNRTPNELVIDFGYPANPLFNTANNFVESIAAGTVYTTASIPLADLIEDEGIEPPGHRIHLLALDAFFQDHREIGVGFASNGASMFTNYWAIHTAYQQTSDEFLTGVLYNDTNGNGRYDLNEGLGGVNITAGAQNTVTNAHGGYSIKLNQTGTINVTASGGSFAGTASAQITTGSGNVHVEFISGNPQGIVDFAGIVLPAVPPLADTLAASGSFTIVGGTGSPTNILSVKIFDGSGNLVSSVTPFSDLTSLRVAGGDFDGDGNDNEFAVLGRRTNSDLRAEIVIYNISPEGQATETNRFFAFAPGILGNGFIATGDMDGDGDDDIAVAQIGGGRAVVAVQTFLSVGDGSGFTAGGSLDVGFGVISAPRIAIGDVDGDNRGEIVISARTPAGADVRVFDVDNNGQPAQSGGFIWTFGIDGYSRGAFVAVGEFEPNNAGEEIVLGSNVGGGGRVDIVQFLGSSGRLVANGRLTPFGDGYNAAVRVAVGRLDDRPVLIAGQDRFQNGQYTILARDHDGVQSNPPFEQISPITALTGADGLAPATSIDGNRTLGPFVSFVNPALTAIASPGSVGLLAALAPDANLDDIDLALAVNDKDQGQPSADSLDELFELGF